MAERPIPPEGLQALYQILNSDQAFVDMLLQNMNSAQPRLLHMRFVEDVQATLPPEARRPAQTVILGVIALSRWRDEYGLPVEDYAQEVVASQALNAPPEQRDRLFAVLTALMSTPSLAVTAKA